MTCINPTLKTTSQEKEVTCLLVRLISPDLADYEAES